MYHFESEGSLLEGFQWLIDVFKYYHIIPLFVFDGKPPSEKELVLIDRKNQRLLASEECSELMKQLDNPNISQEVRDVLMYKYTDSKKRSTTLSRSKIQSVQKLLDKNNTLYQVADGEADELCALSVVSGDSWACMSDDMDMFVYGCNYIIRNLDVYNQCVTVYYLPNILSELNMSYENFKRICILSGTDYNKHLASSCESEKYTNINLYTTLKLFDRFRKNTKYNTMTFYDWLKYYIKYDIDYEKLEHIYKMFELSCPKKIECENIIHSSPQFISTI